MMLRGYETIGGGARRLGRLVCAAAIAMGSAAAALAEVTPAAHVERRGSGPQAMLLIPGLSPHDWTVWEEFMDRNGNAYTMCAVTLPGFGGSAPPPAPEAPVDAPAEGAAPPSRTPWMDNAVAALAQVIDEQGLEQPVVMGQSSLGGFLAVRLAAEHPSKVSRVIAVDAMLPALPIGPTGVLPPWQRNEMVDALAPKFEEFAEEDWEKMLDTTALSLDSQFNEKMAGMMRKTSRQVNALVLTELMRTDLAETLRLNKQPRLVIYAIGEDAGVASMGAQARKSKEISRSIMRDVFEAQVVTFSRSRPMIIHDRPDQFDRTVADYLADRELFDQVPPRRSEARPAGEPKDEGGVEAPK